MSNLASVRKRHNINQEYLAEQLGVTQKAISKAENGLNQKVRAMVIDWWVANYNYEEAYFSEDPLVLVMRQLEEIKAQNQQILDMLRDRESKE